MSYRDDKVANEGSEGAGRALRGGADLTVLRISEGVGLSIENGELSASPTYGDPAVLEKQTLAASEVDAVRRTFSFWG